MGRLAHLRISLPLLLQHTPMHVVVVDYSCPDRCAWWAHGAYPPPDSRVSVVSSGYREVFNKPEALNLGLRHAAERGDEWLCVLDADTLVTPALWGWLSAHVQPGQFYFFEGYKPRQDLTGLLVVHARDYLESGGYDENFAGWGAEDFDMRCRLRFKLGLPFEEIPCGLADSIPHGDEDRTQHYRVKDKRRSHVANQHRLIANVRRWTGSHILDLDRDEVRRLLGMPEARDRE